MNIRLQYRITAIGAVFIMLLAACEKDKGPVRIMPEQPIDSTIHYISYKDYIQPMFNDYCIGCHNSNHPFLDLQGIVSYDQLVFSGENAPYVDSISPDNSLLVQRLIGDEWPIMPPDPPHISPADIDSVRKWMQQGFRDN